jgi:hypothetical protein
MSIGIRMFLLVAGTLLLLSLRLLSLLRLDRALLLRLAGGALAAPPERLPDYAPRSTTLKPPR